MWYAMFTLSIYFDVGLDIPNQSLTIDDRNFVMISNTTMINVRDDFRPPDAPFLDMD